MKLLISMLFMAAVFAQTPAPSEAPKPEAAKPAATAPTPAPVKPLISDEDALALQNIINDKELADLNAQVLKAQENLALLQKAASSRASALSIQYWALTNHEYPEKYGKAGMFYDAQKNAWTPKPKPEKK